MTQDEKERARHVLFSKIHAGESSAASAPPADFFVRSAWQRRLVFRTMPIILMIAILVTGSVAAGAEGSLPGSPLYPIKVNINEEIRSAFAFTAEGKADWEASRALRRVEEAEGLAASGALTVETKAELQERFEIHAKRTNERLAAIRTDGDAEAALRVSAQFEARLKAHNRLLSAVAAAASTAIESAEAFKKEERERKREAPLRVAPAIDSVLEIRVESEVEAQAKAGVSEAAEGAKIAARNKLDEVKRFIQNRREGVSAEAAAEADAEFVIAETIYSDAQAKFTAHLFAESFTLFKAAARQAEEAKEFLKGAEKVEGRLEAHEKLELNISVPPASESKSDSTQARAREDAPRRDSGAPAIEERAAVKESFKTDADRERPDSARRDRDMRTNEGALHVGASGAADADLTIDIGL